MCVYSRANESWHILNWTLLSIQRKLKVKTKKKGDFSVSKMLALEVWGPEFDPQSSHEKESSLVVYTCNPRLGRQRHDYLKLTAQRYRPLGEFQVNEKTYLKETKRKVDSAWEMSPRLPSVLYMKCTHVVHTEIQKKWKVMHTCIHTHTHRQTHFHLVNTKYFIGRWLHT